MASVNLESLGWGSVTSVTSVTPFLHYVCQRFEAGPLAPLCFLVFVFSLPPSASEALGRPLTERSKNLRPWVQGLRPGWRAGSRVYGPAGGLGLGSTGRPRRPTSGADPW